MPTACISSILGAGTLNNRVDLDAGRRHLFLRFLRKQGNVFSLNRCLDSILNLCQNLSPPTFDLDNSTQWWCQILVWIYMSFHHPYPFEVLVVGWSRGVGLPNESADFLQGLVYLTLSTLEKSNKSLKLMGTFRWKEALSTYHSFFFWGVEGRWLFVWNV